MKTAKELAAQAAQLWGDLNEAYQPDTDKLRRGDRTEHERIGMLYFLFGEVHPALTRKLFDFERVKAGEE